MTYSSLPSALARSFLAGESAEEQIVARAAATLGRRWRWLRPLARRYLEHFASKARPRLAEAADFLETDRGLLRARAKYGPELKIGQWLSAPQQMRPVAAAASWQIPKIDSAGALADWLHVSQSELEWFADLKGIASKPCDERLRHYRYRVLAKKDGGLRLIEAPKERLKELQRILLAEILDRIPVHPAAHGFVKGRSIRSFAVPHTGKRVVLRMDLQDFFPSISGRRVHALFRTAGYPDSVAGLLGGLCCNAAPRSLWSRPGSADEVELLRDAHELYSKPHLPQGAPTSPSLANLCAYRTDCRLTGLAKSAGADYTRYADDLAFSGGEQFDRCAERFAAHAAAILLEEGFTVRQRKTRIMRQGVRQYLAGLTVNRGVNIVRADFEKLKAILTNCARLGPDSQNHDGHADLKAHLGGRIGFVASINPAKGQRLRRIFNQIRW
jgi:hypothetical protein